MKLFFSIGLFFCFLAKPAQSFEQLTYTQLSVEYDSAWTFKSLELIPVRFKKDFWEPVTYPSTPALSLQEAFKTGKLFIREMNGTEGADIHVLEVKNRTGKNILIQSGEIVAGGKQDRVFAQTNIVSAGGEVNYQNVFCLEKGRWTEQSKPFSYAGMTDTRIRKLVEVSSRQNEIWREIDRQYKGKKLISETWPYLGIHPTEMTAFADYRNFFQQKWEGSDSSYAGFVAISGTHILDCELFGTSNYCSLSFDEMLSGYLRSLSATPGQPAVPKSQIISFLDKFLGSREEQETYLHTHGKIFRDGDKIIQLTAYANE